MGVVENVKADKLKGKIPSACDAHRLVRSRQGGVSGKTEESLPVLLSFDVDSLPEKVMLGYISYTVRAFVQNTLRCYRCQAYGHVAAVCRRKVHRCERSAEGHETKECVALGKVVICVNCRGAHGAGDQGSSCKREAG